MNLERIKQNLSDVRCPEETARNILRMCEVGNMDGALQMMKKDRCRLMEEMHECGRKVDRLDLLIRLTEKEMKETHINGGK